MLLLDLQGKLIKSRETPVAPHPIPLGVVVSFFVKKETNVCRKYYDEIVSIKISSSIKRLLK
jgi:hypothetical protein